MRPNVTDRCFIGKVRILRLALRWPPDTGPALYRAGNNAGNEGQSASRQLQGCRAVKAQIHFAIPGDINTRSGGYGYDRRLCTELHKLGYAIDVMQLSGSFPFPNETALEEAEALFAALQDGAIVLADGLAFGVMDETAERHGSRLKIIALCHHPLTLETGHDEDEAKRLHNSEQRALANTTAVLVTSAITRLLLVEAFATPESKIVVAVPGTDTQVFATCAGDPPVLLNVAALIPRKAHDVLIEALCRVVDLPWTARLVGSMDTDPAWAAHLQGLVKACDLERRITFTGGIAEPSKEFAAADIFVLPSLYEGYGMVFAEALSFGLPIVAAAAGAVPEVVPESAGVIVPPGDVEALAAALESLLAEPAARARLQRGSQRASALLPDWSDTARTVSDLLSAVQAR